jgi:hypothetical protein
MRCRYNVTMLIDGLICELALHLYRFDEVQLGLRLPPLEGGGYTDHTAPIVRFDKKVRQVRQFTSFPSQSVFLLAHGVRLSQGAKPRARSNPLHRIGYSRAADPYIEREVHA